MKTVRTFVALPLAFVIVAAGSSFAGQQPHIVSPDRISDMMAARVASQQADRAAVRDALGRPEVQRVAAGMGVDVERVTVAVDTLSGADLEQAASAARQINRQLIGGDSSVTLSTTTIIIGLLVLILVIVAVH